MLNANLVNVTELQALYSNDPKVKALLDMYAERQRGRQDSTAARTRRVMRMNGVELSGGELSAILRKFQSMGLGRCVAGRRGKISRFVWGFHLKSVAQAARGQGASALKSAPRSKVKLPKLQATAPALSVKQEAAPAPTPTAVKVKTTERVIVRKAGFEIELPGNMSEKDWKDIVSLLNNLTVAG